MQSLPYSSLKGSARILGLLCVLGLAFATSASAALQPVKVETFVSTDVAAPGERFHIAVRLNMDTDWHTQSNQPSDENFIATEFKMESGETLKIIGFFYPPGHDLHAPALGGDLSVYDDGAILGAEIEVDASAAPGSTTLEGAIRFQACNDKTCLFPKNEAISFTVEVGSGGGTSLHPEIFATLANYEATPSSQEEHSEIAPDGSQVADETEDGGFSLGLLGVFFLGLGLNLTPCVYPVIAVTLSFFGRQGGSAGGRSLRSAAYAAGIMTMFTALFLAAGLTGQLFGSWLQSPWVLAGMAAVMVVLALSSFGLFDLQAPAFLRNRVAGGRSGVLGGYLMGLAMGIVAAPCVGPLIGGLLLWVGQQADMALALLFGLVLSAGLALPYFLLGIFSGSLNTLPKSGDWMDWIKHLMGYVLLGVAVYFLGSILPRDWLLPSFAILAAIAAVHLGFLDPAGRGSHAVSFVRGVVVTAAGVGIYTLFTISQAAGIEWQPYTAGAVAQAATQGKPVVIDFTADWCIPCRVMEYGAFQNTEVIDESERFLRLQVDLTHQEEPSIVQAVERFQVAGPPVIIFLDSSGKEVPSLRILESVDSDELLERMRKVGGPASAARLEPVS